MMTRTATPSGATDVPVAPAGLYTMEGGGYNLCAYVDGWSVGQLYCLFWSLDGNGGLSPLRKLVRPLVRSSSVIGILLGRLR